MERRYISFTLLGILLLAGACRGKQKAPELPPVEVTAFQVKSETIPAIFEFVGVARSSHPVEIRARVEGYIWSIDYVEGSRVKENDLLFQLDPRTYEASLQEALGVLAREEAILWRAKRSLDRMKPLFEKNAVSQRDLDDATADVLAAEASVLSAKADVVQAELNLSYTKVTSPINGLASRAAFKEGTLITPNVNGLLTEVSVIDPIWVLFSVSDNELLKGQSEQAKKQLILPSQQEYTVRLTLADGTVYPILGKVNFSSPILDPDTGSMVVRAEFQNPEGLLLPGQFVKAAVMGAMRPNALYVPQKSVFQGDKGMYVFVINADQTVSMRNVEVGEWYKDYWIIKQGLTSGELVVAEGINRVTQGVHVKVRSTSTLSQDKKTGAP